jgi:serine/threonine protein kinase
MGKVYKVKNTISDRVDALKVLLPDLADDPELADRFIREIKVLASLEHPNIAGLRTAFRLENQLLMVMEYVEGTTLDERAKAGPVPVEDAINYIMQALSALGFAHKHGVIHRDIKPANMMLTPANVIKLMDFGIAKAKSDKKLTQTGTTMGSLYYMSAEQVQGGELDGRSDLYSAGVSLYELVTGTRPFQGKSDFDIMVAQLQQTPQAPIQMMPHLPRALNDIIMISLEKDPAKRFQTAEAFAAALGSLSQSLQSTPMQGSGTSVYGSVPPGINAPAATGYASGMMATQTTPAPPAPAPAVGGTIPPPQPYISTNSMPTVMAPQPPTPTMTPAPPTIAPPGPYQAPPPPSGSKGYRGLYMTLGALIVLAILAVAAVEGTRFLKARAGGDQTAQVTNATANPSSISVAQSTPSADGTTQPATGAAGSSPASGSANSDAAQAGGAFSADNSSAPPAAQGSSGSTSSAGAPSSQNPSTPNGSATRTSKKTTKNQSSPLNQAAGGSQNSSAPASGGASPNAAGAAGGGQAAPQPSANDAAKAQQLAELGELHDKLSVRAVSVDEHVDTLRKQMAAGGNNLRADISSSQTRLKMYMDKFDAAMNAGDPVAAKKYMHQAEHEVETLEKFFGQ